MAGKKPIRWDVPPSCENLMGYAMYLRDQQENLRLSFSQPSRSVQIPLGNGILVSMVLGPVVDFIRVRGPEKKAVSGGGKQMVWDKLPPLVEGTAEIDLSQMTVDPDASGGYYCAVSVINGMDAGGKTLPAEFSAKMGTGSIGWSIKQGIKQDDGTYKVDGKSATLLLGSDVDGECDIIAEDGKTRLKKKVKVSIVDAGWYYLGENGLYYTINQATGELDYLTAGKTLSQVSVSPFGLFGQQHIKRVDIAYHTTMHYEYYYICSVHSLTYMYEEGGHIRYDVVVKITDYYSHTVVATDDPEPPESYSYTEVSYMAPIPKWDWELSTYPWESPHTGYNYSADREIITTEGSPTLPSFLVRQLPMSDGDGVTTVAMKKPDEEIYFVVCYHDNDPTNKTVHWFINSESYASYAFSEDLWMDGSPLRLDNVYYGFSTRR